jgi:hypothetical protein
MKTFSRGCGAPHGHACALHPVRLKAPCLSTAIHRRLTPFWRDGTWSCPPRPPAASRSATTCRCWRLSWLTQVGLQARKRMPVRPSIRQLGRQPTRPSVRLSIRLCSRLLVCICLSLPEQHGADACPVTITVTSACTVTGGTSRGLGWHHSAQTLIGVHVLPSVPLVCISCRLSIWCACPAVCPSTWFVVVWRFPASLKLQTSPFVCLTLVLACSRVRDLHVPDQGVGTGPAADAQRDVRRRLRQRRAVCRHL